MQNEQIQLSKSRQKQSNNNNNKKKTEIYYVNEHSSHQLNEFHIQHEKSSRMDISKVVFSFIVFEYKSGVRLKRQNAPKDKICKITNGTDWVAPQHVWFNVLTLILQPIEFAKVDKITVDESMTNA